MQLCIIAAISENGVIGRGGDLPWHLSADLKRFRKLTTGHHILMGRKTWDSIGRPLPERTSIVITRQQNFQAPGAKVVRSLDQAIELSNKIEGGDGKSFIIGGAQIYEAALPLAQRLYITRVHADVEGDIHFPQIDFSNWQLIEDERFEADERNPLPYSFRIYERLSA